MLTSDFDHYGAVNQAEALVEMISLGVVNGFYPQSMLETATALRDLMRERLQDELDRIRPILQFES